MSSKSLVNLDLSPRQTACRPKFGVLNVYGLKRTLSNNGFDLGRECRRVLTIPECTRPISIHAKIEVISVWPNTKWHGLKTSGLGCSAL